MLRCRALAGLAVALGTVLVASASVHAMEEGSVEISEADVAAYPSVSAVVSTPPGLDGGGYGAEAFTVLEGGTPVEFSVERVPTTNLEIVLVIDTSGSMKGAALDAARSAATEFLTLLPPEVGVGVVGFASAPTVLTPVTTDRAATVAQLETLRATGETALYDAVLLAATQFTPAASDRAIVLLSDGGDTVSQATVDQAVAAVNGIGLNVIELASNDSNRSVLEQLAAGGGGVVTSSSDPAALTGLYRATAISLINRYRIVYTSAGHGSTTLTVRVTTADGVLEASTTLDLPVIPVVTDPPTTTTEPAPTTTKPAPTTSTSTSTSTTQPAPTTTVETRPAIVLNTSRGEGPDKNLLRVGAAALFVALFLLVLTSIPGDQRGRVSRSQIQTNRSVSDASRSSSIGERMSGATERLLERRGRRNTLARALESAGITLRPGEFVLLTFVAMLVGSLAAMTVLGRLGGLAVFILVPMAARALVEGKAKRRRERFAEQLPDTLQLLTSSLRAGYGVMQAIDAIVEESMEPMRSEFRRVVIETRVGRDLGDALRALGARMGSTDFDWVVGAIDISREVGGDLAQILDTVADTIRERQRLRGQVQILTAEGRLSAYILIALPPVMAALLRIINPGYFDVLTTGRGLVLVIVGCALLVVGWTWMRRVIRLEY